MPMRAVAWRAPRTPGELGCVRDLLAHGQNETVVPTEKFSY